MVLCAARGLRTCVWLQYKLSYGYTHEAFRYVKYTGRYLRKSTAIFDNGISAHVPLFRVTILQPLLPASTSLERIHETDAVLKFMTTLQATLRDDSIQYCFEV